MSLAAVARVVRDLPPRIQDDVLGYARSVNAALPEIFREAGVEVDRGLGDELVFIAGVKKLHATCSTAYWVLDNSLAALRGVEVTAVRLGSAVFSRESQEFRQLRAAVDALDALLREQRLTDLVNEPSYPAVLELLRRGR